MSEEQAVTEEKPEVKVEVIEPIAEKPPEPQTETPAEEKPEKKDRFQKRIDKLTREKYELKGRVETLEKMMTPAQPTDQEPKREQYQDDLSYLAARQDFSISQKMKTIPVQQAAQQPIQYTNVADVYPDYEDVLEEGDNVFIPENPALAKAITSSPNRDGIIYQLAKNPEQAKALYGTSLESAIRMIGKIEAKVESDIDAKKKPVQPKTTKAPAPINPIHPSGDAVTTDLDKMTPAEFAKYRNAQEHKRRWGK